MQGASAMSAFKIFPSSEKGNVGMMLALAIVPIMLSVGVAVDMVQTNRTLTIFKAQLMPLHWPQAALVRRMKPSFTPW